MKPQKAKHFYLEAEKKTPGFRGAHYHATVKYDGWYGYMDTSEGLIRSRAGRVIPSLRDLSSKVNERLQRVTVNWNTRIIFEIVHGDDEFHKLNGILNRKSEQAPNPKLMVHDLVDHTNIEVFVTRIYNAALIVNSLRMREVEKVRCIGVSNREEQWKAWAQEVWDTGGEGIILKRMDGVYSPNKRNSDLMKIKEEVTKDLLVVDVHRGEGKYRNSVGTLEVVGKRGKSIFVSGMDDSERECWWKEPHRIIGKVVEIKAMKELPDGMLREPRFKAIRHDKTECDIDN